MKTILNFSSGAIAFMAGEIAEHLFAGNFVGVLAGMIVGGIYLVLIEQGFAICSKYS